MPLTVWTIGHSSRTIDDFLTLLSSERIQLVADVRRFAGSRAHPHFNPLPLTAALAEHGVDYLAFPDLGGRRKPRPDTPHTVWRNPSFRAYADYMDTPGFTAALDGFVAVAEERRAALMCSEAVWWRCHRSMIADALKVRGVRVLHIMGEGKTTEHPYTSAATVVDGELRYGAAPGERVNGNHSLTPSPVH